MPLAGLALAAVIGLAWTFDIAIRLRHLRFSRAKALGDLGGRSFKALSLINTALRDLIVVTMQFTQYVL